MSYDLKNENGNEFFASSGLWSVSLNLAERHGWKPAGTSSTEKEWGGSYDENAGQYIAAGDAAGLAKALESAISGDKFQFEVSTIISQINLSIKAGLNGLPPEVLALPEFQGVFIEEEAVNETNIGELIVFLKTGRICIE